MLNLSKSYSMKIKILLDHREFPTSQDCLHSIIFRMVFLSAWCTNAVAVAFMYCFISVLASVVARKSVEASSARGTHTYNIISP